MPIVLLLIVAIAIWLGWRIVSRRSLLPCPSELAWLVELENPLAHATRSTQIIALLAPKPGDRVVDVGCGPGRVTIPLAHAVGPTGEVVALDLQPAMLEKVAARVRGKMLVNVRLLPSDVRDASLRDLDAAVMVMALGEIPEPDRVFAALASSLKPCGRLLIAESVFDPHFVRRRSVRQMAQTADFEEIGASGNLFGYSIVFRQRSRQEPAKGA